MTFKTLRVDSANQITTITLNRPSARNSLNVELMGELRELVDQLRGDASTRAVIITGAGRVFSAGADVDMLTRIGESYTPEQTREEISKWRATFDALEALPQVTIAAVNGLAYGGGVVLALVCDFRLASSRAIFGLPEIKLGMVLALGGTQRLTRLVGTSAAKEMILRGRNVTALEAQRLGLVHRVSDPGDLMGLARSWAGRAVNYSPRALALAKRLIDQSYERDAGASGEAETAAQVELLHSPEFLGRIKSLKESGEI
ncbi:MAG: enoyl-CoA hydratase/isomerase family protein [Chloroflexota bacterium]|nr:enoyl-CoA hydratase/isomerase family protein [Chloroflexota bacterium]